MDKPNFAADVRRILKNEGKASLNAAELRKCLRKFWQDGYQQGWNEGRLDAQHEAGLE